MIPERIFSPHYSLVIGVPREPHRDKNEKTLQVLHVTEKNVEEQLRGNPQILNNEKVVEWLNHKSTNMNTRKAKVGK